MQLNDTLLSICLVDRMQYDAAKGIAYYNFQGLRVTSQKEVEDIRRAAEELCNPIGKKILAIVNYDNFQIDEAVVDDYSAMVKALTDKFYTDVRATPPAPSCASSWAQRWRAGAWRPTSTRRRRKPWSLRANQPDCYFFDSA